MWSIFIDLRYFKNSFHAKPPMPTFLYFLSITIEKVLSILLKLIIPILLTLYFINKNILSL